MEGLEQSAASNIYVIQATDHELEGYGEETPAIDDSSNVDFFTERLNQIKKQRKRIKGQISRNYNTSKQFSSLITLALDRRYKCLSTSPPKSAPFPIPLPPIHESSHKELKNVLRTAAPLGIIKFLEANSCIPRLIFENKSVFDTKLETVLLNSSPDNQVAFFKGISSGIFFCRNLVQEIIPIISETVNDRFIRSRMTDDSFDKSEFFGHYQVALKRIASLMHVESLKLIYCSKDGHFQFFPTETYTYVIDPTSSLCGYLLNQGIPQRFSSPQTLEIFDTVCEAKVFSCASHFLSVPFKGDVSGLFIFSSNSPFSESAETIGDSISEFLAPVTSIFASIFTKIAPSNFSFLSEAISKLRGESTLFQSLIDQACLLTSASKGRLLISEASPDCPGIEVLPHGQSIITQSINPSIYKNPRSRPDFNKKVDDDPSLQKLSSMMVFPIRSTRIILVLYNATISSEFSPLDLSMVSILAHSVPPILHQYSMKQHVQRMKEAQVEQMNSVKASINSLIALSGETESGSLFQKIESYLPEGIKLKVYFFLTQERVIKLPDMIVNDAMDFLKGIEEATVAEGWDGFQSTLFIPFFLNNKCLISFCSQTAKRFGEDNDSFTHLSRPIVVLSWAFLIQYQTYAMKKQLESVSSIAGQNLSKLSELIGAPIEYHSFNPPLGNDPEFPCDLTVSIETGKGIEAALTSQKALNDERKRNVLMTYAEHLSASLSEEWKKADQNLISIFINTGILTIFKCSEATFSEWISKIISWFEKRGTKAAVKAGGVAFVQTLIEMKGWSTWFTQEEKVVILLMSLLQDINQFWRCSADSEVLNLVKDARPEACPAIACIFGHGFGISDGLDEESRELLVSSVNDYFVGSLYENEIDILSHIRIVSLNGIKASDFSKLWLGRSLVLLSKIHIFSGDPETVCQNFYGLYDEATRKRELFKVDRVYIPVFTFIAQRTEFILQLLIGIRNSLKIIRNSKK